ncbi:ADP-ribosyl-[dinitrogen reductase] glycohydrolase [Lacunisphaera limnophila]|uniref:ADP-ribosyl-[dinitrogen reductase] glycohydrolase n=1 Tax=Lacunisphaera limnophila TaxID=1838286 RepID=A0A1D8AZ00_9BACT|nr:ADP-ribosylglycohydrolase family protein [Lacunisphaera limnophila]AOS46116.1 ADP-ribosyl-[dinitrogen reductase] glycohydrolase [Lacunisphaera limnophila]
MAEEFLDRARGSLVGLAVGDALGSTFEFTSRPEVPDDLVMMGGGPFALEPGQWTDDTSLALCLAESLILSGGFNPLDQMKRYARWLKFGHNSCRASGSGKRVFDVGIATREAILLFVEGDCREPYCGSLDSNKAGNGSIMRLAPVPAYFAHDLKQAIMYSAESSKTTHGAPEAVSACAYLGALIWGALHGYTKEQLVGTAIFEPTPGLWREYLLEPRIRELASGEVLGLSEGKIRGTGYCVDTLKAALWAFVHTNDFQSGCIAAIRFGEDTDTVAAVYGQLAGAYYGESAIPPVWKSAIARRELVYRLADRIAADAASKLAHGAG